MIKPFPLIVLIIVLSGCATKKVWYQPGKSYEEARKDIGLCKLLAEQNGNPLAMLDVGFAIQDKMRKTEIFKDCMASKGYELVDQKSLPK